MLLSRKRIKVANIIYLCSYLFIAAGIYLINNNIDVKLFFVFWELLYLPIVFGLPVLSIAILFKIWNLKNKTPGFYICLTFAGLTVAIFAIHLFSLFSGRPLIF